MASNDDDTFGVYTTYAEESSFWSPLYWAQPARTHTPRKTQAAGDFGLHGRTFSLERIDHVEGHRSISRWSEMPRQVASSGPGSARGALLALGRGGSAGDQRGTRVARRGHREACDHRRERDAGSRRSRSTLHLACILRPGRRLRRCRLEARRPDRTDRARRDRGAPQDARLGQASEGRQDARRRPGGLPVRQINCGMGTTPFTARVVDAAGVASSCHPVRDPSEPGDRLELDRSPGGPQCRGMQAPDSSRDLAIVALSVYDAVNAIDRQVRQYGGVTATACRGPRPTPRRPPRRRPP